MLHLELSCLGDAAGVSGVTGVVGVTGVTSGCIDEILWVTG